MLAASERFVSKPDTCVLGACLLGGGHSLLLMIGRSKSVQLTDDERKQWERSIKSLRKTDVLMERARKDEERAV